MDMTNKDEITLFRWPSRLIPLYIYGLNLLSSYFSGQ